MYHFILVFYFDILLTWSSSSSKIQLIVLLGYVISDGPRVIGCSGSAALAPAVYAQLCAFCPFPLGGFSQPVFPRDSEFQQDHLPCWRWLTRCLDGACGGKEPSRGSGPWLYLFSCPDEGDRISLMSFFLLYFHYTHLQYFVTVHIHFGCFTFSHFLVHLPRVSSISAASYSSCKFVHWCVGFSNNAEKNYFQKGLLSSLAFKTSLMYIHFGYLFL